MATSVAYSYYAGSSPASTRTVGAAATATVDSNTYDHYTSSPSYDSESYDSNTYYYYPSTTSLAGSSKSTLGPSPSSGASGSYGQGLPSNYAIASASASAAAPIYSSSTAFNNSASESESHNNATNINNGQDGNGNKGHLSLPAIVVISIVVTLGAVGICFSCCLYRRRRRRLNTLPGGDPRRKNKNRHSGGRSIGDEDKFHEIDIQALPSSSPLTANSPTPARQPRFSQRDLNNILISNQHQQYTSTSPFADPSPLSRGNTIRPPSRRTANDHETDSLYTDNSEFDMLAQDGSSYARTLSTYSEGMNSEYSERDLSSGSYIPQSQSQRPQPQTQTPSSTFTGMGVANGRPRLEVDTKSSAGPISPFPQSSTFSHSHSNYTSNHTQTRDYARLVSPPSATASASASMQTSTLSPFSDPYPYSSPTGIDTNTNSSTETYAYGYAAQPLISPISASTSRSWRTEDEVLFTTQTPRVDRRSTPGLGTRQGELQRGVTIVRHTDGGATTPRPIENEDGAEEEEEEEVHLPPSYRELYPQNR
ncbi:uncharacterized protein I303_103046 [Kwoniella dejecticola CBS 10117]|uniref:Uncharacterized protein n=1 Tax=Kwoniella dejecticola CBS 10117 TaxID=1296121 RepID=A0A1A6AAF4_9TREE|nr:uncharacterized protein I303_03066 [Kwoniella dejecticola CBS 10117]OBR87043.1 hypothetical protein I303_03066 [Kwoniella dejecticola CBS 10117]